MTRLQLHRHGPDAALPLVLLPAFPFDATFWDAVVARLAPRGMPLLTVDLPGFGGSPRWGDLAYEHHRPVAPSIRAYGDEVFKALDDAGVGEVVVAGISLGGYVAMAMIQADPQRVRGLGLLDTKAEADREHTRSTRERIAETVQGAAGSRAVAPMVGTSLGDTSHAERPRLVADVRARLDAAPVGAIVDAQRAMADRPDSSDALRAWGRLGRPALVLRGDEDGQASADSAQVMAQATGTDVVTVRGAGHLSALEDPDAVVEALQGLYERVVG